MIYANSEEGSVTLPALGCLTLALLDVFVYKCTASLLCSLPSIWHLYRCVLLYVCAHACFLTDRGFIQSCVYL